MFKMSKMFFFFQKIKIVEYVIKKLKKKMTFTPKYCEAYLMFINLKKYLEEFCHFLKMLT